MPSTSLVPFTFWLRLIFYWQNSIFFRQLHGGSSFWFLFILLFSFVRVLQNVETACSSWKLARWDGWLHNLTNCVKMAENRACQAAARSVISWTIAISNRLLWSIGSNWRLRATAKCNEWILEEVKAQASFNNWNQCGTLRSWRGWFFLNISFKKTAEF